MPKVAAMPPLAITTPCIALPCNLGMHRQVVTQLRRGCGILAMAILQLLKIRPIHLHITESIMFVLRFMTAMGAHIHPVTTLQ